MMNGEKPTLLLMHGAGTGAWVWNRTVLRLAASSVALDLPHGTPDEAAASLVADLGSRGAASVVPVLHSVAGVLAGPLSARLGDRMPACIFLSAVIPADGEAFVDAIGEPDGSTLRRLYWQNPEGLVPPEDMTREEYCNDLTPDDCRLVVARYRPEPSGLFVTPVSPLPANVPATYIRLAHDRSVRPALQERMIARLTSPRVLDLDAGHLAMLSRPEELAALLDEAVSG